MKPILNNLIAFSDLTAIECYLKNDSSHEFNIVSLKKVKNSIEVVSRKTSITENQLSENINTKIPVVLILNGKGIIYKKINDAAQADDKLLNAVLPNAAVKDFYMQRTPVTETSTYISVIRKKIIDDILDVLKKKDIRIISCSLGPFSLNSIIPIIGHEHNITNNVLSLSRYNLELKNNLIDNFYQLDTEVTGSVTIGDEKIESSLIVAFSKAFETIMLPVKTSTGIITDTIKSERDEFIAEKKFKMVGMALLVFFLSLLTINFLFYSYYSQQISNNKYSLNNDNSARYVKLKNEYLTRTEFVNQSGVLQSSKTSFYADRIANTVPEQIQLTELSVNPLVKTNSTTYEDSLAFNTNTIIISGICNKSLLLNQWIKKLKSLSWIKEIQIINFKQDKAQDMGQFQIQLNIGSTIIS